ncbi:MAG TPA: hypothetical protein VEG27_09930 [Usitatibacter sp.]|nr:hypothetical protein [Usitatibacter sp.]
MKSLRPLLALLFLAALPAHAAGDPKVGKMLVEAKGCDACHARQKLEGAPTIYQRKDRKVGSLAELKAQVSACNHGMHLDLTPNDERDIVAFLNEAYYKFK